MADNSAIEWTDATWNPIRGCTRVSPGCGGPGPHGGCYAERIAARFSGPGQAFEGVAEMRDGKPRWTGKLVFVEGTLTLTLPLRWRRPRRIFVNSMSDLFHEAVPDAWIDRVFAVMALAPQHTFQVLTKRSVRMRAYLSSDRRHAVSAAACGIADGAPDLFKARAALKASGVPVAIVADPLGERWPLPNVWLGVSAEDQARADERVPDLLATPAAVRWVSAEPLLEPIDFGVAWHGESALGAECWGKCAWCDKGYPPLYNCSAGLGDWEKGRSGLDWLVVGGESGPDARPMHPQWAREIRDQCAAADVPFFFKQRGDWSWLRDSDGEWPTDAGTLIRLTYSGERDDGGWPMQRVGKTHAGRLLDGIEHNGMPEIRACG